ncbi:type II secretion system F family protein [Anaerocolumna sp. MB42-C2]|uniref:type II secretion system F family protein n=1 Tax=Anaerocolumna sp. MB42-C2 TaxID=3070997 RepID=UPI0027DFD1A1|nr:type II secretion system F family protein [Anaerocolumna sp. MB42-C2]WMJ88595.1 type II secretion system F family protein [Anaerocolumna sp. MB42-C2]
MASFRYVFIDQNGKQKTGTMEAVDKDKVILTLKAEDKIPIKVKEQNLFTKDINFSIGSIVKPRELAVFCRQFHSIISAGISIIHALEMLGEQTENKALHKAIKETQAGIEKGETLAAAMKLQGDVFPPILINMIEAGEASGKLDLSLERMSIHFEKDAKLKAMLGRAFIYPAFIGGVSLGVIILMLLVVVPNFMGMFRGMDMELPTITLTVIHMSNFIIAYWYFIILFLAFLIFFLVKVKKTDSGKLIFSKFGLRLPLFGNLIVKTSSARLGKTLGTLLDAGIPLLEAIDITAKNMDNVIIKKVLIEAKEEVARGVPLSEPLAASGVFPPMVYHMIGIGEETGHLEQMLNKIAAYYEEEVENTSQALVAILEPMIIIILSLIVSVLLFAIIKPLLAMYQNLDQI